MSDQVRPKSSDFPDISIYALAGYIFDEAATGFRVPVFVNGHGKFYTCDVAPSNKITEMYELPNTTEDSIIRLPNSVVKKKWRDLAVGSRCPMIFVEDQEVYIQTLDDARCWVFACALRADIDPYQRVSFSSVLSLPIEIVSRNYPYIKPVFADTKWLERQVSNYLELQRRLLGPDLYTVREKISPIENRIFSSLIDNLQPQLEKIDVRSFRTYSRQMRISGNFISAFCEALSSYLHSIQIHADNNATAHGVALRTLYSALTYLDVAHSKSDSHEEIRLTIEAQKPIFSLYILFALQRFLHIENDIPRNFSLDDDLATLLEGLIEEEEYIMAEKRFEILDQILFEVDSRKAVKTGSGFFVKISHQSKHGLIVVNSSGSHFTMPSDLIGYGAIDPDSTNSLIRVEKLRTSDHVTSRGVEYVTNTLDCYFPAPKRLAQRTFASNAIHMILCEDTVFADIVRASKSHQALSHRLNVHRMLLVKYRNSAFSQMKEFVNSIWRELEVKFLKNKNIYIIVLNVSDVDGVDVRKVIGFYRALEILCELNSVMWGVSDRIRFILRASNVDSILRRSDVLRDYLKNKYQVQSDRTSDENTVKVAHTLQGPLLKEIPKDVATDLGVDLNADIEIRNLEVNNGCRFIDDEEMGIVLSIAA